MQRMRGHLCAKIFWVTLIAIAVFCIYRITMVNVSLVDYGYRMTTEDSDARNNARERMKFRPGKRKSTVSTSNIKETTTEVALAKLEQSIATYNYDNSPKDPDKRPISLKLGSNEEVHDEKQLWKVFQKTMKDKVNMMKTKAREQTISSVKSSIATLDEQCPIAFQIADLQANWFQTVVIQRSHKTKDSPLNFTDGDDILILTPISDSQKNLRRYFENLCSLTYPHHRISIVLGEDSSGDGTLALAEDFASRLQGHFRRIEVVKLLGKLTKRIGNFRHDPYWQFERRRHLAMARNQLIAGALRSEKYVLWIDSDVRHIPADLVEHLMFHRKQVIVPHCLYRKGDGTTDTFDRNTWRETNSSRQFLNEKEKEYLMLEGYAQSKRLFLSDLKTESDVVRLDGVGGCILLVEADLHRRGLIFPPFVFDHHIETEGMAKMAAHMGVQIFGLPSVNIIHW